jgi:hypothetical protein
MRRVGMLIGVAENDTETQTWQPPFGSGSTTWAGGSLCRQRMKVRTLWPGQKVDDVAYRCGEEVIRSVPRAW